MAELNNGPLGGISGKLGNMVASNWRDISYLRAKGKRSKNEPTEKQVIVREKFTMMFDFLIQLKDRVENTFKGKYTGRATAFNLALKANMGAFTGTYPDLQIDLPKIQLSTGRLVQCAGPKMEAGADGRFTVTWGELGQVNLQQATDEVTVVLYSVEKKLHAIYEGAQRKEYELIFAVPQGFSGDTVHGYIYFTNADGTLNSKTTYLGTIKVP